MHIRILGAVCLMFCSSSVIAQSVFLSQPTGAAPTGWSSFAIMNRGDTVPLLGGTSGQNFSWTSSHALFDGLGAYRLDSDTIRVYVNHEVAAGGVSRVDLSVPLLDSWISSRVASNTNTNQTARPAGLVQGVGQGWTAVGVGSASPPLNRPCSGNFWEANTFGSGRGFSNSLYFTGEESGNGHFWAIDSATNTIYQAPSVGGAGSWENATLIDTGRNDTVALLLGEDRGTSATGTAALSLYVGQKNPNGNFLERNGLVGGKTYVWDAIGANTNGTLQAGGIFANNNDAVAGTWTTNTSNAVLFSKAEDVHTNMQSSSAGFGREAILASQDQALFHVDLKNLSFIEGDLAANQSSTVRVLLEQGTSPNPGGIFGSFAGFDNLVWSPDGNLYVNEDDGEGDVWRVRVSDLLSQYQSGNLSPTLTNVTQLFDANALTLGISESSGIIDISDLLGYQAGGVFLVTGQGSAGDQMAMLVSSSITSVPEPSSLVLVGGILFWMFGKKFRHVRLK
ncbi:MAG: PEP-CTERM sorting domain-containing protein [Pirellula sp.]